VASTPFEDACWRKSWASNSGGCVEVAFVEGDEVLVRDSKAPHGAVLRFNHTEWSAFLQGVRSGQFDPHPSSAG
jgi:uncharacterized protein DUF397